MYDHSIFDNIEQRSDCILACGWALLKSINLEDFYKRLRQEKQYYRAAAISILHFDYANALIFL